MRRFALLLLLISACSESIDVVGFSLTADVTNVTLARGQSRTVRLTTARIGGYDATIRFETENLPAGVTAFFSPVNISGTENTSTLTLTAAATAPLTTVTITVRGLGLSVAPQTVQLQLAITDASAGS